MAWPGLSGVDLARSVRPKLIVRFLTPPTLTPTLPTPLGGTFSCTFDSGSCAEERCAEGRCAEERCANGRPSAALPHALPLERIGGGGLFEARMPKLRDRFAFTRVLGWPPFDRNEKPPKLFERFGCAFLGAATAARGAESRGAQGGTSHTDLGLAMDSNSLERRLMPRRKSSSTRVASDARSVAASERTDAVSAVGALERFEALSRAGSPLQLRR